ncbi:MAG TPA: YkgJ family cysteine cluster protein [Candidatus Obscuribacterales bacterium]
MPTWRCVKFCGACCHLDPSDRPDLDQYLSGDELALYLSMVGEDGWCMHFDHNSRECSIYDDRPRFCRVQADVFQDLYDVGPEELNDFAIDCCEQQIEAVYGDRSLEMLKFEREIGLIH